jgi:hypothetical protein
MFNVCWLAVCVALVEDLEALIFNLARIFIRNPNVRFSTETALLPNCR